MNRKINIAQVIYGLKYGGAEKLLIPVSTKLDKNKFYVIVIALTCGGAVEGELKKKAVEVYVLRRDGGFGVFDFFRLIRLIKKKNIDIIHSHLQNADLWAGCAARICGIKHVSTFHGTYFKKTLLEFLKQRLRVILPDRIIAVSKDTAKYCIVYLKAQKDKVVVINNGVDVGEFRVTEEASSIKRRIGIPDDAPVLGTFGRLEIEKGHRYLIEAVSILKNSYPNIRVLIGGGGSLKQKLIEMTQKLGLKDRVIFLGERNDIPELLQIADIVVIPSLSEGFSLSCLEAMAVGRPIVATDVGGVPELMEDKKDALLVDARNPFTLAKAILTLIENRDLAMRLALQAKEKVGRDFSIDKMLSQTAFVYEEIFLK